MQYRSSQKRKQELLKELKTLANHLTVILQEM